MLLSSIIFGVWGTNAVFATEVSIEENFGDDPDASNAFLLKIDGETYSIFMNFPDDSLDESMRTKKRNMILNAFKTKFAGIDVPGEPPAEGWLKAEPSRPGNPPPQFKRKLLEGLNRLKEGSKEREFKYDIYLFIHNNSPDWGAQADRAAGVIRIDVAAYDPANLEGTEELKNQETVGETLLHEIYHFAGLDDPSFTVPEGIEFQVDEKMFRAGDKTGDSPKARKKLLSELNEKIQNIEREISNREEQITKLETQRGFQLDGKKLFEDKTPLEKLKIELQSLEGRISQTDSSDPSWQKMTSQSNDLNNQIWEMQQALDQYDHGKLEELETDIKKAEEIKKSEEKSLAYFKEKLNEIYNTLGETEELVNEARRFDKSATGNSYYSPPGGKLFTNPDGTIGKLTSNRWRASNGTGTEYPESPTLPSIRSAVGISNFSGQTQDRSPISQTTQKINDLNKTITTGGETARAALTNASEELSKGLSILTGLTVKSSLEELEQGAKLVISMLKLKQSALKAYKEKLNSLPPNILNPTTPVGFTEDIDKLIEALGAGTYEARERATNNLIVKYADAREKEEFITKTDADTKTISKSKAIEKALKNAENSNDTEIQSRAKNILDTIAYIEKGANLGIPIRVATDERGFTVIEDLNKYKNFIDLLTYLDEPGFSRLTINEFIDRKNLDINDISARIFGAYEKLSEGQRRDVIYYLDQFPDYRNVDFSEQLDILNNLLEKETSEDLRDLIKNNQYNIGLKQKEAKKK